MGLAILNTHDSPLPDAARFPYRHSSRKALPVPIRTTVQTKPALTWSNRSPDSKNTMPAMRNNGPVRPQWKVRFFAQLAKHPIAMAKRHADGDPA